MTAVPAASSHLDACRLDIAKALRAALESVAVNKEALAPFTATDLYGILEKPPEAHLGDFSFPCFRFAKAAGAKPDETAARVKEALMASPSPWIRDVRTVGAFLNIYLDKVRLAAHVLPRILDGSSFTPRLAGDQARERVMIEFSQPNTHKLFHVGHMRNVALGDAVGRLYRYLGHDVIAANYIGDEGTHIAKCLWYIERSGEKAPAGDKLEWLGHMYAKASMAVEDAAPDERAAFEKEISAILSDLESKQGPRYEYWKISRQWSLDVFHEIYAWLDVTFDHVFCESDVSAESQSIVDEYLAKGVFHESEGAIGVDLKAQKAGFALLRKRDGNTLYLTKDLALARRKFRDFKVDRSIYVVASEQNLHFKQAFKILEMMGFAQAKNCFHLSYGMVTLPDGKMSSRKGNIIPFTTLKESLEGELDKHLDKYRGEWSAEELSTARHRLCLGAIKFGMLFSDPVKDIVFDIKDWLSFEGNTGPYLMYSYTRTSSILRKAEEAGAKLSLEHLSRLGKPEEWDLLRYLYDFQDAVESAARSFKPSVLAHYLFDMCKSYNRFYAEVPVLKAEDGETQSARLALLKAFTKVLAQGLSLLGMVPPERM